MTRTDSKSEIRNPKSEKDLVFPSRQSEQVLPSHEDFPTAPARGTPGRSGVEHGSRLDFSGCCGPECRAPLWWRLCCALFPVVYSALGRLMQRMPLRLSTCCIIFIALFASTNSFGAEPASKTTVLLVVGAAGEEEYGQNFSTWAENWIKACRQAHAKLVTVGLTNAPGGTDKDRWKQCLTDEPKENDSALWIVLLGHGTYDGKETKFNLQGPDVSATELADWLKPFHRSLAVIDSSSASAPFIHALSAPGRVVLTATQSGYEQNYARFGQFLSEAIADPNADLDKDGQTSLLEAFLSASHRTEEFYKVAGRLATEHALIDDNGDGLGTPASWFRGIRAVKKPRENASLDGLRAHQFHLVLSEAERRLPSEQRARRDALELTLSTLREKKGQMAEDAYYSELEKLLLELAKFYE